MDSAARDAGALRRSSGFVIYLREFGLGEEWRKQIAAALSKGAMHVSIEKLRVDPFRGLIAENVHVRDELDGGRAVGNVKQIVCSSISRNCSRGGS